MNYSKRIILGTLAALMLISSIFISASAAETNSFPYSFKMKADQGKSYSKDLNYRGTGKTSVPWMVNMTFNAEGEGTKAQYFLASSSTPYENVSAYKTVTQGSGAKYFHAYSSANKRTVQLAARNNNDVTKSYTISGYWDEETAEHSFDD